MCVVVVVVTYGYNGYTEKASNAKETKAIERKKNVPTYASGLPVAETMALEQATSRMEYIVEMYKKHGIVCVRETRAKMTTLLCIFIHSFIAIVLTFHDFHLFVTKIHIGCQNQRWITRQ